MCLRAICLQLNNVAEYLIGSFRLAVKNQIAGQVLHKGRVVGLAVVCLGIEGLSHAVFAHERQCCSKKIQDHGVFGPNTAGFSQGGVGHINLAFAHI